MPSSFKLAPLACLLVSALTAPLPAVAATLIDINWETYDPGTLLNTISGWQHVADDDANVPVIAQELAPSGNRFLTTGTVNNQATRYALPFVNPGFFSGTTLTFTVDMWDPLVNSQSSVSTFPRACIGIYELAQPSGMPPYFGMETNDANPGDDLTTAEWVMAGEDFGNPPSPTPRMFSPEGSIAQDTWYSVKSVWNFGTGTMNLQVKPRDSAGPYTSIFENVPIGFTDPSQDLAALDAFQIRMLRGTRIDNIRVEYDVVARPGLPGDYNRNNAVDAADFAIWRQTRDSTTDLRADGNGNGQVDQADYDLWQANFGRTIHLAHFAEPSTEVLGAPARSDVMFSVRSFFSSPSNYPQVAAAFHATRNDWTYSAHISAGVDVFTDLGGTSGGAMHASIHSLAPNNPGIARHWDGVTPLSHWNDDRYSGDVNAPEYRASALAILKGYINAGNVRVQWDDPRFNTEFVLNKGGSFAPASVAKYRDWLAANTTSDERAAAGLPVDVTGFDYRLFVQARNGVVSSAATELWMTFHYESSVEFLNWIKQEINDYAGFEVAFTGNNLGIWDVTPGINTERQEYIDLYRWFDYGIAELYAPDQNPQFIFNSVRRAEELGKRQAFTLVSTNVQLNRKVMSYLYAVGGHMIMPWDVYVPNSPRFFGNPNDYNDITALVRQHAGLFDGYELAAFVGQGLTGDRTAEFEPMKVSGGSGQVYAFARAKPDDLDAPILVHLVDWDNTPDPFMLLLRNDMFGWPSAEAMSAQLFRPGTSPINLSGVLLPDGYTSFNLPGLAPYGFLAVYNYAATAGRALRHAVPEPSASALLPFIVIVYVALRRQVRRGDQAT